MILKNLPQQKVPISLPETPCVIRPQVSLAPLTSLRTGGSAQWYADPHDFEEIQACLTWAAAEGLAVTLLGAGSNLLISDRGLPGLVLSTRHLRGTIFDPETGRVIANAGEPLPRLAWEAARRGWSGLEWAAGIPGTVGGAVVMNAGAQGGCTADLLVETQVFSQQGLETLGLEDLNYGYRTSVLQQDQRCVTQATFQLQPGADPKQVQTLTSQNLDHRKSTQPYHLPSCGSVFRNPNPYKAGWLIEQTGLKGYQIGQAQVAQRHANFIVNCGGAVALDVFRVVRHVQQTIWQEWSLMLEPEVKILGQFPAIAPFS
jgi:UDP-N-acetylmuramate dehydrogenase